MAKKKILITVAILLVVIGVVALTIGLLMGGSLSYTFDFVNGLQPTTASSKLNSIAQVDLNNSVTNIDISTTNTGNNITALDATDVVIMRGTSYNFEYLCNNEVYLLDYIIAGDTLDIDISCNTSGIAVSIFGIGSAYKDELIITVPQAQQLDNITVRGDFVDLEISDIVAPTLDITIDVGEVDIFNCDIATMLNIVCYVGDVDIEACVLGGVYLETDVGNIGIQDSSVGKVEIRAEVGNVEIEECSLSSANIVVDVGNIEIELLSGNMIYAVDATVDAGKISIGNGIINGVDASCNQLILKIDVGDIDVSIG